MPSRLVAAASRSTGILPSHPCHINSTRRHVFYPSLSLLPLFFASFACFAVKAFRFYSLPMRHLMFA